MGNWSGLVSYPDDGGMKQPARIVRKRYNAALKPLNPQREREKRVKVNKHECHFMHVLELLNITMLQRQLTDFANATANQRSRTNLIKFV